MNHGARPLRTTRRMQNYQQTRPGWYKIQNQAKGKPTLVSIYDEIGFLGVSAGDFMAELRSISGDIEMHLNSPGGDVFDGIAIYNQLKQRQNSVHVIIDGLAASAASFIAQAASPGLLEMAPHSQMMIHDGFAMAIGNAADLRDTADLLDKASDNIAAIYADRTGQPAAFWRDQMRGEKWYSDSEAVDAGLADRIHGKDAAPQDTWDLSVFASYAGIRNAASDDDGDDGDVQCPTCKGKGKIKKGNVKCPDCGGTGKVTPAQAAQDHATTVIVNADGNHAAMTGTHSHSHPAYGAQGSDASHSHEHSHDGDASHSHHRSAPAAASDSVRGGQCRPCNVTYPDGVHFCGSCGKRLSMADSSGWVQDPDTSWRFDPDNCGGDHSTPEGDTGHAWFAPDGTQLQDIPPCPGSMSDLFVRTILNADVDNSPWDASKAWKAGAASDDPAAFYKGICAGRKAGDPATQGAWALPYKYSPSSAPNAAGVRNALSRLDQTQGLTNKAQAQATLEAAMKTINPDYKPDDRIETGLLAAALLTALEGAIR